MRERSVGAPAPEAAPFHFRDCVLYGTAHHDGCGVDLKIGNAEILGEFARLGRWLDAQRTARGEIRPTPWALGRRALDDAVAAARPPVLEGDPWVPSDVEPPSEEDREEGYLW